jgi:CheY-like chemotaxis protein
MLPTILIVDDHAGFRRAVRALLEAEGYRVVAESETGGEALEAACRTQPMVVLLDIGLPDIDGYEVARRLRADARTRDLLIIAITGYGREEDLRRSREAGIDEHVVKPVDPDDVLDRIARGTSRNSVPGE